MKKNFLLALAVYAQVNLAFSQENNKAQISLTAGPAFPTGQFANTNLSDEASGFAKPGEAISLSLVQPISKDWALVASLADQRNPVNTKAFESGFSNLTFFPGIYSITGPNDPPPQLNYVKYPNWKFEHRSWQYATLQAGIQRRFFPGNKKKVCLAANVTIGALYVTSPQLKGSSTTDTATATITQSKSSAVGLIYSLGIGMNYFLNKRVFLTSNLNYTGTDKVTFKDMRSTLTTTHGAYSTFDYSVQQSMQTVNGKQSLGSMSLLVGVGFTL